MAEPRSVTRLMDLRVDGRKVTMSVAGEMVAGFHYPEAYRVIARKRKSTTICELSTVRADLDPDDGTVLLTAEQDGFERGVWDLYFTYGTGERSGEVRFGRDRSKDIPPEGFSNADDRPQLNDYVVAYFTKGAANLSIDSGGVLHKSVPVVKSLGLVPDEDGRAVAVLGLTREPAADDEYFCTLEGAQEYAGRQLLPTVRLGERLMGLRLPASPELVGATMRFTAVVGGARTSLVVTGAEYWPARLTGFELRPDRRDGLEILKASRASAARHEIIGSVPRAERDGAPRSFKARMRSVPLVGDALAAGHRKIRGKRQ
ncbi:hypothetical protein ACTXM8_06560 [Brachybacterium alimentarium]|uniref:hypothetical protein n=1 Tax=Brachybacterium alimentarium TaxID=47845 RepID=UPI003FD5D16B